MRRLHIAVLTLTLCSAVAVAAEAQDSLRIRQREPRTFVYSFGPDDFRFDMRRGRLGITVDLRADAARDTVGARVSGVTPGGPADRAGVQSGDIITRLNGSRLVQDGARSADDDMDRSRPGMRLIELASRLDAGDTVRLDVRRDNRPLTLTFAAGETDMDQVVERMRIPGGGQTFMREFGGPGFPGGGAGDGMMRIRVDRSGFGDVELISVSQELASALGISEGVLVTDAGRDSSLGLKTGDVITSIGGRRPTSPAHAMRILSSYDPGETVAFEVMRQRRRVTVNGKVPQPQQAEWRVRPNSFDFTMPRVPGNMMRMMDDLPMRLKTDMQPMRQRMMMPDIELDRSPRVRIHGPDQEPQLLRLQAET